MDVPQAFEKAAVTDFGHFQPTDADF